MPACDKIRLPDLLFACPFNWSINPHYERARDESTAWIESFNVFTDRRRSLFKIINSELLAALVYPYAGFEELRTCCDFINLLFVIDEISDESDRGKAQELGIIFLDALSGRPTKGSILSKMTEEFRDRFVRKAGPKCLERFIAHCASYIFAVCKEAGLRQEGEVLERASYMRLRRDNSAVKPCFGFFEYIHGVDLPAKVFEDPVFIRLYLQGIDMVCLSNDLYSFSMERAKGLDGNNFVTVIMKEKGMSMQEAADYTGAEFTALLNQFLEDQKVVPSFGKDVDEGVQNYIFSISQWVIGNIVWSFDTPRYFGADHAEVKKTLIVNVMHHGEDADAYLLD